MRKTASQIDSTIQNLLLHVVLTGQMCQRFGFQVRSSWDGMYAMSLFAKHAVQRFCCPSNRRELHTVEGWCVKLQYLSLYNNSMAPQAVKTPIFKWCISQTLIVSNGESLDCQNEQIASIFNYEANNTKLSSKTRITSSRVFYERTKHQTVKMSKLGFIITA